MKDKVLLAFYGVVSRSIEHTYPSIKKNMIDILHDNYDLDIYIFNNNIENNLIDNTIVDNNMINIIPYTIKEEKTQTTIDNEIREYINKYNVNTKMRSDYTENTIKNSLRQMYSEEQVGIYIENNPNKYKCIIVCGPDYYLLNKLNIKYIDNIIKGEKCVYTTNVNDAMGYTNGLYIGQPINITKILKRFSIVNKLLPTNKDYEYLLKHVFISNKIERQILDIDFVKIRANKKISYQGRMIRDRYKYRNGLNNFFK